MTDAEIDQFCQRTLAPAIVRLAPLQAAVTRARFQFGIAVVVAPVTVAVVLGGLATTESLRPVLLAARHFVTGGVIATIAATLWGLSRLWQRIVEASWRYACAYKRDVVGALVAAFDRSWTYAPDTGYPYLEYEKSDVALTPFDEYTSEDTITGVRDGKPFLCVELHTKVWRGRGQHRRLVTLFRGLFIRVTLGGSPDSRTVVLADSSEKTWGPYLGRLIERWRLLPNPIVHLEHPDFEREFVVHSSDAVAAHRLLTPRMMQQLAVAVLPARAQKVDISGEWLFTVETGMGSGSPNITFKQDGEKLTGTYSGQLGNTSFTGTVVGTTVEFSFTTEAQGQSIDVAYKGTVDGKSMKGTVNMAGGQLNGTFTGTKK